MISKIRLVTLNIKNWADNYTFKKGFKREVRS